MDGARPGSRHRLCLLTIDPHCGCLGQRLTFSGELLSRACSESKCHTQGSFPTDETTVVSDAVQYEPIRLSKDPSGSITVRRGDLRMPAPLHFLPRTCPCMM